MSFAAAYMLDTNTASYLINGRSPAARRAYLHAELLGEGSVISALTEAELRHGLEKNPGATRIRYASDIFLTRIRMPWDSAAALAYSKLRTRMNKAGKSLATIDMLIAAHAFAAGATLVSHDQAFEHLADFMPVNDWVTDL